MGRKINASYTSTPVYDVEPDAVTTTATVDAIVGNTALAYDALTGELGSATPHAHTGGATGGTPLGVPVGQSLVTYSTAGLGTATAGDVYLAVFPCFVPAGETSVTVTFGVTPSGARLSSITTEVRSAAWAVVDSAPVSLGFTGGNNEGLWQFGAVLSGLTGGTLYYVGIYAEGGDGLDVDLRTVGVTFEHRQSTRRDEAMQSEIGRLGSDTPVQVDGSDLVDFVYIDDTQTSDGEPLTAWMLNSTNRNHAGTAEVLTGSPAGSNASYTVVSGAGDDPAESAFHDHSQSTFASEGAPDFPITILPLGSVTTDGLTSELSGAPHATSTGTLSTLFNLHVKMPDFPDTGTTRLNVAILASAETAASLGSTTTFTNFDVETIDGAFSSVLATMSDTTGAALGSSRFHVFTFSGAPFYADTDTIIRCRINASFLIKAGANDNNYLGVCVYFT